MSLAGIDLDMVDNEGPGSLPVDRQRRQSRDVAQGRRQRKRCIGDSLYTITMPVLALFES